MKSQFLLLLILLTVCADLAQAADRPNIILVYTDDISARELPVYGSSTWTPPLKGDTSDQQFRAQTPVLDQMAQEGCWVKTAWASVVCSPSRAMMMTGRYAHRHKWWANSYRGRYIDESGKATPWPFYKSCPQLIGHFAQQGGYATYWAGKTQVAGDLREYGFQQGCFTPGNLSDTDNPFADFKMVQQKVNGEKIVVNTDTGKPYDTYPQHGWYFNPHVRLMNHDGKDFQWWPNTPETIESFGVGTYGPDVELDYIFDFMKRQSEKDEPFFVYHTTHLGHGAFDWINPDNGQCWPGTPVIKWDGKGYTRTEPNITGDAGEYDTHGTVTENGMHTHIEYLDYQMWQYRNKLQELGIAENTVVIFCSDNGSSGYGKNSADRQKGVHVPLIIYAPGMTKHGEQNVLVNMSDMLPTVAELAGVTIPDDYEINGESLVPFLYTDQPQHRDWIYGYKEGQQLIRGRKVMKDGFDKWWDVTADPDDLISFPEIKNWDDVSPEHRAERDMLKEVLPRFDLFGTEPDAPGVDLPRPTNKNKNKSKGKNQKNKKKAAKSQSQADSQPKASANWKTVFQDNYEKRTELGSEYSIGRAADDAWVVTDGVLLGKQTNDDHGAVIRVERNFDDADIQFDFQFNGGKSFNLVIDDKNEQSVHAGHICRVSISPKRLTISDDKTGSMNLEVRKQRQNKNLSAEDSKRLAKIMEKTRSSVATKIQPDQWHNLRVRIKGDIMKAFLDGEMVTSLRSPGFDHPTKTKLGFTVNGTKIGFDNFVVKVAKENSPAARDSRSRKKQSRLSLRESSALSQSEKQQTLSAPNLKIELGKVSRSSVFVSDTQSIWGGSVVKGSDGQYHMLYSRWPKHLGWAWVTDSEIAHAVADNPLGPYSFQNIALARRGKEHWDGWCTHNPTVHKFGEKYYLYYMGNTGDGKVVGPPGKHKLNWVHRNNQRIGVAVADDPAGPWTRLNKPVLDINADDATGDSLMTSNPSVCQRPDGKILMVYKAVGKKFPLPSGGPVIHMVAIADEPTGPFKKMPNPVFTFEGERFPAEDPYIWFQDGKYRAIVKRIKHVKKNRLFSLVQYDSENGIDWQPSKHHEISDRTVTWEDGTTEKFDHLERPQVVVENGVPVALTCAADRIDEKNVRHSFNLQIPLIVIKD